MDRLQNYFILGLSFLSIGAFAWGMSCALRSNLFLLQEVEVKSSLDDPPLDDETIVRMAGVPVGSTEKKVNLFVLDLKAVERRLMMNDLIQGVSLEKRPPRTLVVSVDYRVPRALIQTTKGSLAYVGSDGKIFGSLNLASAQDLPMLSGFSNQGPERTRDALDLLSQWENSPLGQIALISSIHWDSDRGFQILAAYSLNGKNLTDSDLNGRTRTIVDFGMPTHQNLSLKLFQLTKVFRYLSRNAIASRHIWADTGKKIVVKTAYGS